MKYSDTHRNKIIVTTTQMYEQPETLHRDSPTLRVWYG